MQQLIVSPARCINCQYWWSNSMESCLFHFEFTQIAKGHANKMMWWALSSVSCNCCFLVNCPSMHKSPSCPNSVSVIFRHKCTVTAAWSHVHQSTHIISVEERRRERERHFFVTNLSMQNYCDDKSVSTERIMAASERERERRAKKKFRWSEKINNSELGRERGIEGDFVNKVSLENASTLRW